MLRERPSETPTVKVTSVLEGVGAAVVLDEDASVDDKTLGTLGLGSSYPTYWIESLT